MSIRNDQHIYVTQSEKLERLQLSHDALLAAAKQAYKTLCVYIDPLSDVTQALKAAIAKAEDISGTQP
jgi:hypothetical protein